MRDIRSFPHAPWSKATTRTLQKHAPKMRDHGRPLAVSVPINLSHFFSYSDRMVQSMSRGHPVSPLAGRVYSSRGRVAVCSPAGCSFPLASRGSGRIPLVRSQKRPRLTEYGKGMETGRTEIYINLPQSYYRWQRRWRCIYFSLFFYNLKLDQLQPPAPSPQPG